MAYEQLGPPSRQCACAHGFGCAVFLASKNMTVVPHPFTRLIQPSGTSSSPKMKIKLKVRRFDTAEDIQAEKKAALKTLTQQDLRGIVQSWQKRWVRCVRYFEGDDDD